MTLDGIVIYFLHAALGQANYSHFLCDSGKFSMQLSSMTGFARAAGAGHGVSWQWELRSVNSKSLDLRLRLPPGYEHLEPGIRAEISAAVRRGNIQAALTVDTESTDSDVAINETVLSRLLSRARELQKDIGGPPVQAEVLLGLRGVIDVTQHNVTDDDRKLLDNAVIAALRESLTQLVAMRNAEGRRLAAVLSSQINSIEQQSLSIRNHPSRTVDAIRERLREQVQRLLDTGASLDLDRLHQEALLLATRNDVQEELDRLDSHVEAARGLLKSAEPVGRKLDFLTQEFNREANTICSKANDKHVTAIGLNLKTVIDQLREQVQNIE